MSMRVSAKNLGLAACAVALVAAGFVLLGSSVDRAAPTPAANAPALPVPVVPVIRRTVPVYLDFVGTTEAIRSVSLQARVTGYLVEQGVPDGADVKSASLLYRIDLRPYQAALDQVIANRAHDQANLENAELNFRRDTALLPRQLAVTQQQYDTDKATVAQLKAQIAADDAAIETARLNVGYTEILASFAGRIGRSLVHEGTLISAAGTQLNTLVQLDPIYVTFNPSESDLAHLGGDRGAKPIPAEVTIPDQGDKRYAGTLTFLDNVVDRNTGTIVARATIANPDHSLLPGKFVHVRLHVADQPDTLLVPQVALGSNQFGKYVYVADHDKAVQRPISIGATYGSYAVITKGLTAHDEVIVGNLQKIAPGTPVRPTAARPPAFGAVSDGTDPG
jgi:membrane fusion protein, multidrug efflux system